MLPTHTRYVTPWLRTSVHKPFEIIAESGGPKTRTWIERKLAGRWERVSTGHGAFRISDDRAFYESCSDSHCEPVIAAASGETVRLPDCHGWITMPAGRSEISAAKHINRTISELLGEKRRGRVFVDRYHSRILNSPRSVRNAIAYVLNNWRKHGDERGATWKVDPFSSGVGFAGWKELEHSDFMYRPPPTYQSLVVWLPKSWLLRTGWTIAGSVSVLETPATR